MKTKFHPLFLLSILLVIVLSLQSCTESNTSGMDTGTETETTTNDNGTSEPSSTNGTATKKHSEMSEAEYSGFAAKHADHVSTVTEKMIEIKNEHIKKKDYFTFECQSGKINLERLYNDEDEIHLMSIYMCKGEDCSNKNYFFENNQLIYEFHHHEVKKGDEFAVDDHKTYYKDGKMLKCLEKTFSYKDGDASPNVAYQLVDCNHDNKTSKDMVKLLTLSEEQAKALLCN